MAKAKKYFIRTGDGQKGPYSLDQMRASIKAKSLSPTAEYRKGEEGEWQPVKQLIDRLAKEEVSQPRERKLSEDQILPPAKKPDNAGLRSTILLAVFVVLGLGYWMWQRSNRQAALGKPCTVAGDCPSGTTCMLTIEEDRSIQAGGYCTFQCSDSSDCGAGLTCGEAMEMGGPQGAKWDGMFKKGTRMCLRK